MKLYKNWYPYRQSTLFNLYLWYLWFYRIFISQRLRIQSPPPLLLIDFTSFKIFLCFVVLIVNEEKNNHKMKIYVEVAVQVQLCESYFTTGVSVVFARACKNWKFLHQIFINTEKNRVDNVANLKIFYSFIKTS